MSSALIVAHPGHELRVHGWLTLTRPMVVVLTDGSGHDGPSRLGSTSRVLAEAGGRLSPIYGRFSDREIYRAMLDRDVPLFLRLADDVVDLLVSERVSCIAGDAAEGYNPTHDLCRFLIDAAVRMVERRLGRAPLNLAFPLVGRPDVGEEHGETIAVELGQPALDRKLAAAHAYAELIDEVTAALGAWGPAAFRRECLHVVEANGLPDGDLQPFYERHGERRVSDRRYARVIRYRDHVRPVAEALRAHAESGIR